MVSPKASPRAAQGTRAAAARSRTAAAPTMMAETMVRRSTLASALPPRPESPSSMFMAGPLQVRADLLDDAERGRGDRPSARPTSRNAGAVCSALSTRDPEPEPDAHADGGGQPHAQEGHGARERLGLPCWLGGFVRSAHPDGRARRRSLDHASDCCPLMRCVARRSPSSARLPGRQHRTRRGGRGTQASSSHLRPRWRPNGHEGNWTTSLTRSASRRGRNSQVRAHRPRPPRSPGAARGGRRCRGPPRGPRPRSG